MINCRYSNDIYIVELSGDIDHYTSEKIKREIYLNTGKFVRKMIIDLTNVEFMDSSGIGMILGRYREIKERNGKIALTGIRGNMERIFNMSGLYKIISKYNTISEALKEWGSNNE